MYKLIDLLGDNGFTITKKKFKSKKEILEALIDFHWCDWMDDKIPTLRAYINKVKGIDKRLKRILNYGMWGYRKI